MTRRAVKAGLSRGAGLLLLLTLCLGLRAVALARPCLSDDEATYCVVGREMLSGHVLYRDVVDHKPPLIYLTYAATQAIGGHRGGMRLLHLVSILVVFATALLLGRIARLLAAERGEVEVADREAFFAALLYVVFSTALLDFDALAANCELFMMLPLVGSVLLYMRASARQPRGGYLFGAGALIAVAMLYKYQAGVQLPLYGIHLAALHRRRLGRALAGCLLLGSGALVIFGLCAAVMRQTGALASAWFWFRFNFAYIRQGLKLSEVAARAAARLSYAVLPSLFLWVLGVYAAKRALVRGAGETRGPTRLDLLATGWLLLSVLATTVGGRFFGHYFYQVIAPLAVLAAPATERLWARRRGLVVAAMGVPAGVFFLLGVFHRPFMAAVGQPDPDYPAMAAFLEANYRPGDRLVVWGNAPVLYFEADHPLGSRFVFSNYLTGLSPATRTQSDPSADSSANVVGESWDMFESDLAARRPRLFVDTSPGNIGSYGKFPPRRYPRLAAILARDYRSIGQVGGAEVLALTAN
jgi:hypothetical protein